jgi:hypothetical protein
MRLRTPHYLAILAVAIIAVVVIAVLARANQEAASPSAELSSTAVIGQRTKSEGCAVQGTLQDKDCTPGAVFSTVTKDQICTLGYAKSVRNVPESEKQQAYAEYGITRHRPGEYEVDHLVSLELGGSNEIANLWPEAASGKPGFHEKDRYENYLHDQVCSGRISLPEAQRRIADNWLKYWTDAGQP